LITTQRSGRLSGSTELAEVSSKPDAEVRNQSFVLVLVVVLESAGKLAQNRAVDLLQRRKACARFCGQRISSSERTQSGKEMLVRIVAMLTKLGRAL
jgi:hypothetical protein